jgi:polyhydroxybutyrate depolymerase
MTFFGDLLDDVETTLCVDRSRVFVAGLSNGAMMTSAVACAFADRVAAVAPVAGLAEITGCAPARPVPMVAFHGTEDQYVSYEGGLGPAALQLPAPDGSGRTLGDLGVTAGSADDPSIPEIAASWAKRNGCGDAPEEQRVASDVVVLRFPCPTRVDVELYRIDGGGHTWPGSALSATFAAYIGTTTMSISADEVMWRFFEAHPLALTG